MLDTRRPATWLPLYCLLTSAVAAILPHSSLRSIETNNTANITSLPQYAHDAQARAQAIEVKRIGYLYGISVVGTGPQAMTGDLGSVLVQQDFDLLLAATLFVNISITNDLVAVEEAIAAVSRVPIPLADFQAE